MRIEEVIKMLHDLGIENFAFIANILGMPKSRFNHLKKVNAVISEEELERLMYFVNSFNDFPREISKNKDDIAKFIMSDINNAAKLDKVRSNKLGIADKAALYTLMAHVMENGEFYSGKVDYLNTFLQLLSSRSYQYLFYFITFANKFNLALEPDNYINYDTSDLQAKMEVLLYNAVKEYFKYGNMSAEENMEFFRKEIEKKKDYKTQKKDIAREKLKEYLKKIKEEQL